MQTFNIQPVNSNTAAALTHKINYKTKPLGALGLLEKIALQVGCIQETLAPVLNSPTIVVFAADHGITQEGVSPYPQEVTYQMVFNFLHGGAGINVFAMQHKIALKVVDAGVNFNFDAHPDLIDAKIDKGTKNYLLEPAMTAAQCTAAINKGAEIVLNIYNGECNVIGFGEMGIGNTSSAAIIMSLLCGLPLEQCIGRGTGLNDEGLKKKHAVLAKAMAHHQIEKTPFNVLQTFGGFEIAMICGAMLKAAELKMIILVDGFIATSALLVAAAINKNVLEYCIFCHQSDEQGHALMLQYLKAEPILHLGMRLGEGTGAAVAFPLIRSAVNFLTQMSSFESAGVSTES
jgi:nicotinate-nucleotide--dimethylbenzimidazole phosphoribosyltransferase